MLKDTLVFDSEDEYRFTGTLTSPKEIVAVAMERAGMGATGGRIGLIALRAVVLSEAQDLLLSRSRKKQILRHYYGSSR
jgi:hypothetical protein